MCLLRRVGGVRGGGGGTRLAGRGKGFFFYLDREGEIREKVVFVINNLPQTGKIFVNWFDRNQLLAFPAKGMDFKVSCGGCNKY